MHKAWKVGSGVMDAARMEREGGYMDGRGWGMDGRIGKEGAKGLGEAPLGGRSERAR